ncbi:MAG: hypothetical protein RL538_212 [Candidatus Parcubacteria bacterium]|jgi:UPF0755 protein
MNITEPIPEAPTLTENPMKKSFTSYILAFLLLSMTLIFCASGYLYVENKAPSDFVTPTVVTIEEGSTMRSIATQLERANVVRSGTLLYFAVSMFYDPTAVKASVYVFEEPLTTKQVAERLVTGDFGNDLIKFTHYEGERATSIADTAETQLINFDKESFLARAVPLEGKLYPETYHIPKTYTSDELIDLMLKTFAEKTVSIQPQIDNSQLSFEEVLVLASILEREANSPESMKVVSGILQGRMEAGMPLQADASIEYVLNKPLKELTSEDLKVDSPYNTYTNKGLPPTPIGNPGIDAIMAVLEPERTDYVFYITDNEGNFHYSVTYDEHLDNIEKYLR